MPEFKCFIRIHVPYEKVWEYASIVSNIQKWSPVKFQGTKPDDTVRNGLNLIQVKRQFGVFGRTNLFINDAYMESKVRRQYSMVDKGDPLKMNRVTYMFDDNSISTMIRLTEDPESKRVLEEQAKSEPAYQIDVMAHVYFSLGSNFWNQIAEFLFVNPVFKLMFEKKVKHSLATLKALCEGKPLPK
jgi:ligand-binding SRPBCC domain-containing protein